MAGDQQASKTTTDETLDAETKVDGGAEPEEVSAEPSESQVDASSDAAVETEAPNDEPPVDEEDAPSELEALKSELQTQQEQTLRIQAELQNIRRRSQQDVEKAHKFGVEKFAKELLPVIDSLEHALSAVPEKSSEEVKPFIDGVDMTLKMFVSGIKKFNLEQVDPVGQPFDPALHQAMSMQENANVEPNTVIGVMQKGYSLHGRLVRPALVMVSKQPANGEKNTGSEDKAD